MAGAVRVRGLRELQRDFRKMSRELSGDLRSELREAGDIVRDEARHRFAGVSAKSAGGYRTAVRARGVAVEQRLGRTTGKRPDWGAKQMSEALVPALDAKASDVEDRLETMLDRLGSSHGF